MWARLILVALLVVCLFPTFPSASSFREKIVVLEKVMAKEINEKEALFSFVFKGERMEYVLQKNEDLDMIAYKGRDSSGYKTRLNIVYGGWERPMVFFPPFSLPYSFCSFFFFFFFFSFSFPFLFLFFSFSFPLLFPFSPPPPPPPSFEEPSSSKTSFTASNPPPL